MQKDAGSPLKDIPFAELTFKDGAITSSRVPEAKVKFADILRKNGMSQVVETHESRPDAGRRPGREERGLRDGP